MTAAAYSIANLPLKDDVLENASFLNFPTRQLATFTQVEFFVERLIDVSILYETHDNHV